MKRLTYLKRTSFVLLATLITINVHATPINLNDFFADPTVTVSGDGSFALIAEDALFFIVLLSNDPGLGDPEVILAAPGNVLSFDFDFVEGVGNDDAFGAFILDSTGDSAGLAFEFFTQDTASGTVAFDLSSLTGEPFIGLQFELSSFDFAFDSTVTVSNVRLENVAPVPEASTLLCLVIGFFGVVIRGVWSRRLPKRL